MRILIAEDNPINQQLIRHILEKLGYQVEITENGQETVDRLPHQELDRLIGLLKKWAPKPMFLPTTHTAQTSCYDTTTAPPQPH